MRGPWKLWAVTAIAVGLAGASGGCRGGPGLGLPEIKGGIEIGVRRGSAWSTITVRPPYLIGSRTNLKLQKGKISGTVGSGSMRVSIEKDSAQGTGPYGAISVDIDDTADGMALEGTWNGARVVVRITAESFRATVPVYAGQPGGAGIFQVSTCQYVLDKVEPDGSRSGMSICGGLPEDTLIEIPAAIHSWLTRSELMVVLLALLSTPPYTVMETSQ